MAASMVPTVPREPAPAVEGSQPGGPVIETRDLRVVFPARRGRGAARAVDEVNLAIGTGEIVALIGESCCGKSTLARALVGLIPPTGGEVRYRGKQLRYSGAALKEHLRRPQHPYAQALISVLPRGEYEEARASEADASLVACHLAVLDREADAVDMSAPPGGQAGRTDAQ